MSSIWARLRPGRLLVILGCLAFVVVVFGPLGALTLDTVVYLASGSAGTLAQALPVGRRLSLLGTSVLLAVAVAATAMALGVLVATVLGRWRTGPGSYARWTVLVLAPVPTYVHALAWSSAMASVDSSLQSAGLSGVTFQGLSASWWVETMAALPLAIGLAMVALESVPPELQAAGRLQRPDLSVLARVTLPLARPIILAGGGLLVVLSLLDYSVPALYQVSVYSLDVFAAYSASNSPERAFIMALPLLLISSAIVVVSLSGLRHVARQRPRRAAATGVRPRWPRWFRALQAAACLTLAAQIFVPLTSLTRSAGSIEHFVATTAAASDEISYSIRIGVATALLCLPLALAASQPLLSRTRRGRSWWLVVAGPLAIPAPLVGIGLIALWNRSLPLGPYGTITMPVLAALARFAPFAVMLAFIQARQLDPDLIDAARLGQKNALHGWMRVRLPMLSPGLLAGACLTFALSLGELGATLIVVPPGHSTLSMRIYNYLHYGASDTVAGLCLILAAAAVAAGSVGLAAMAAWSRFGESHPR